MSLFDKLLRVGEGKALRVLEDMAAAVNALEPEWESLTDEQIQAKTGEFRQRLENGETLDDLEV